jgi:hypothetical protein
MPGLNLCFSSCTLWLCLVACRRRPFTTIDIKIRDKAPTNIASGIVIASVLSSPSPAGRIKSPPKSTGLSVRLALFTVMRNVSLGRFARVMHRVLVARKLIGVMTSFFVISRFVMLSGLLVMATCLQNLLMLLRLLR